MPQHLRTQNSNTLKKNTGHSNPATSESVTARKILDLWIILMKRKGVILLPHLFFPPIWLAKSSFMVAYVTPSWISVAPWPGSLAISLVCTNWQPCGRTEAQEGVKIYPLIFKHGNGNSPINGGFDGNIIYKWGNHKWWEFCWTIHDVSHELPSTACPWRIFNLEIQKLQMFIAGNIWEKKCRDFRRSPAARSSRAHLFIAINAVLCCISLRASKPRSWVALLGWEMGLCNKAIWWEEWWFTSGFRENKPRYGYGTNTIRDEHPSIPAIFMRAKGIPWLLTHPNFCCGPNWQAVISKFPASPETCKMRPAANS